MLVPSAFYTSQSWQLIVVQNLRCVIYLRLFAYAVKVTKKNPDLCKHVVRWLRSAQRGRACADRQRHA